MVQIKPGRLPCLSPYRCHNIDPAKVDLITSQVVSLSPSKKSPLNSTSVSVQGWGCEETGEGRGVSPIYLGARQ